MSRIAAASARTLHELPAVGPAARHAWASSTACTCGHQALLERHAGGRDAPGAVAVALVFDPHPDEVLRPGTRVARLAPLAVTLRRIGGTAWTCPADPLRR